MYRTGLQNDPEFCTWLDPEWGLEDTSPNKHRHVPRSCSSVAVPINSQKRESDEKHSCVVCGAISVPSGERRCPNNSGVIATSPSPDRFQRSGGWIFQL